MEILIAVFAIVWILVFAAAFVVFGAALAVGIALLLVLFSLIGIGYVAAVIVVFMLYFVIECVKYRNSTS